LQAHKDIDLEQSDFRQLVRECIADVTPLQQQQAARLNNRAYMHRILREMLDPGLLESKDVLLQRVMEQHPPPQRRVPFNSPENSFQVLTPLGQSPRWDPQPDWDEFGDISAIDEPDQQSSL
jgi:hypothetical protein